MQNTDNSEQAKEGNEAIDDIAQRMLDAYEDANNDTLYIQYYRDKDTLDDYIRSRAYTNAPICFAIGWNTYSPETKEYNIDIRMDYSDTVITGSDLVKN